MKLFVNLVLAALIILTVGLGTGLIDIPAHHFEWFLAILATASALAMLGPGLLAVPRDRRIRMQAYIGVMMILTWVGAFGGFRWGIGYDSWVHLISSFLGVFLALEFFNRRSAWIFAVMIVLAAGVLTELFEYASDLWWNTSTFGELGQSDDTARDLVYDAVGVVAGAVWCHTLNSKRSS